MLRRRPRDEGVDFREDYPPYVVTPEERRRWDLAAGIAELLFDAGPDAWLATRSIYSSGLPTEE